MEDIESRSRIIESSMVRGRVRSKKARQRCQLAIRNFIASKNLSGDDGGI
jgi:hypothetical protein